LAHELLAKMTDEKSSPVVSIPMPLYMLSGICFSDLTCYSIGGVVDKTGFFRRSAAVNLQSN
jgi:hypothetical protein